MSRRTKSKLTNVAASVKQRLSNHAREKGEDFSLAITHYAIERRLYRVSCSRHCKRFVLKGAMLLSVWSDTPYRPTMDLDLLGYGPNRLEALVADFREICQQGVENDGIIFLAESVRGEEIREDQEYQGVRLNIEANLGNAKIFLQVDVGFGDAITPTPEEMNYPTILDFPAPRLLTYSREAVVAEKFQAMVALGITNSRMKDFFDVWFLARHFAFDGQRLSETIRATFDRRRTMLPSRPPIAFSPDFSAGRAKQAQWQAFLGKAGLPTGATPLGKVIDLIKRFLMPPVTAQVDGEPFAKVWPPGGPWQDRGRADTK